MQGKNIVTVDGNTAAAQVAYAFTEVAAIYPITPSSSMAEQVDKFSVLGKKNIFGSEVQVTEMQSEAGAAGAIHGALSAGTLATTFTSSQGLLLMIPNMYKIAGELLPSVIHVAARSIATHALSIFGDHSDVYACRQTGYAMICSNSPQEAAHMSAIAHLSTISSRIPFVHFFDGFRTSHEIQKICIPDYKDFEEIFDWTALNEFRSRSLNPEHPIVRGTAQNDDVYFQNREASNIYYNKSIQFIENYMDILNSKYHTQYKPFEYYGSKDAERVIIAMGSVCETIEEVVDYLITKGEKVGLIKVRVYRPFSENHLLKVLPLSVKKISVLDRTKEPGAIGEPLYLDVLAALKNRITEKKLELYSGRYGLSSKNTTPGQIISVYENMNFQAPKYNFTVGINDDVTHLSLKFQDNINTIPKSTYSCKFWGIGSDGTVGAAKNSIKIIGDNTDLNVQGFFSYDSKKSGGTTVSHLRFGPEPIKSTYYIDKADFVACHASSFISKYDILKDLKPGGFFLLNSDINEKNVEALLPNKIKKVLAEKNINFYILNATEISRELGLGGRVNTALQAAFFKIINIFEPHKALSLIKSAILNSYGKKGEKVVEINNLCAEEGMKRLIKIIIPDDWKYLPIENEYPGFKYENDKIKDYVENVAVPINKKEGNQLPVSAFLPYVDGSVPLGSVAYEKRSTASFVPSWKPENCIECNLCSYVCPHAVIRPFALSQDDVSSAHDSLKYKNMIGIPDLYFSVNISVKDCTGCGNCVEVCPGMKQQKALEMKEIYHETESQKAFEYAQHLNDYPQVNIKFKETTVKGSQFKKPLLEFSGACAGCGETPYAKLATQLFGDQMIIANATGCSSIWGASFPSTAYTTVKGKGPAWHNSLFEDNAEFGYGIAIAKKYLRNRLINEVNKINQVTKLEELKIYCKKYLNSLNSLKENNVASLNLIKYLESCENLDIPFETLKNILDNKDSLSKKSIWIFGGDGWAYDIGFGGLDHVIASGENVNILVFDTEVYSNTGGQASKSTPEGAVAQFAISGKKTPKKNLAAMVMNYENVYVASVSLGADYNQCIKAFVEAESYNGPSIIIAYSPCINHGIKGGMKNSILSAKNAVKSGYWNLFRFDPRGVEEGREALKLDSVNQSVSIQEFLDSQTRYKLFKNLFPEKFKNLIDKYTSAKE